MKRSLVGALVLSTLLVSSVWGASLTAIETNQEEKEQVIRIRAQGALPYQVLEQTSDTLVLFLPHSTLGNLPSYFSFQPLADMRLEANPIGLQLRLENIGMPFRIRPVTKAGQLEIAFKPPPPPVTTPTSSGTSTPSTGSTTTTVAPQLPPPLPTCPVGPDGKPLTISTACQPPGAAGTTGSISDDAVEEADPIRPGVPVVPKRPVKP